MNTRLFSVSLLSCALSLGAVAQDQAELASLRAKAEKGNGIAQYNLGLAYTRGGDVPVDPAEAYVWLTLAQENGARGRALESLVTTFDQPTLQAAQARLAERRAQLGNPPLAASAENTVPPADNSSDRLRAERDALSAKITELAAELSSLRAERDRLTSLVSDFEKSSVTHAAELAAARNFAQQVESTLNKVNDQKAALETQLRTAQSASAAQSATTDARLTARISELEAQLVSASRVAAPAYPDLSNRVRELETQLASVQQESAARTAAATAVTASDTPAAPEVDVAALQKKLAETEDKLATALRGFAFMQRQADEKAATASQSNGKLEAEKTALDSRLAEVESTAGTARAEVERLTAEVTQLRRLTASSGAELEAERAVAKQLRGANTMLAKENYELKARLVPSPGSSAGNAAAESAAAASALPPARAHTVAEGDSLSKIAQRYYGDSKRWPEIYNANREKFGTDTKLRVGLELRIP